MEKITSRKNPYIQHIRALASDPAYRHEKGEYLCDGIKTLREALCFGAEICSVMWKNSVQELEGLEKAVQYTVPEELFDYASTMKNSPGPLFCVKIPKQDISAEINKCIVLEGVQDPGNVGTVVRTANAFGIDAVVLTGGCADMYNPKTVRATMGAVFRQRVYQLGMQELLTLLEKNGLPLYGAALSPNAKDIRGIQLKHAAVAVGSEGQGLTEQFLSLCSGELIIPMQPDSESLNAGVAASVIMWEMSK